MSKPNDNDPGMCEGQKTLDFWENLVPPTIHVFDRKSIDEITGGVFRARHLCNLMSKGQGPKGTRIGNKVAILRQDFIDWVKARYNPTV